ncbi:hypothetical protein GCK72_008912 [Caenorhabditis remanei]|uniref:DUF38 domain-containing protein n=1 Tax=Caenorhabditis remanei TaxID=31234 RepID=A0A6A5H244_CAERE|nr:hypothetical protein GCK72_008912 [Caenorhabditis remanei]KAF1760663.1 hypothetical protein GCK72_008912 [Caenorhabditis remanei]
MESSTPLSYLSTQTVLKNLSANKRFQIFQRCPTLRNIEQTIPLKIDELYLGPLDIKVDDTKYRVEEFKYPSDSEVHKRLASHAGSGVMSEHRNEVQRCDNQLFINYSDYDYVKDSALEARQQEAQRLENLFEHPILNFVSRGMPTPGFEKCIRLISSVHGSKENLAVTYQMDIEAAMKSLIWKLFAGRPTLIVKNFKFNFQGIHKYPLNFKIFSKNIEFANSRLSVTPALQIIDPACLPLDTVTVNCPIDCDDSIVQTAKLRIVNMNLLGRDLRQFNHPNIYFKNVKLLGISLIRLLEDWVQREKPIGTFCKFRVFKLYHALDFISMFEQRFPDARGNENSLRG